MLACCLGQVVVYRFEPGLKSVQFSSRENIFLPFRCMIVGIYCRLGKFQ
jgi:hypothetical protein